MPRNERISHVLKIQRWSFDYSFGVGDKRSSGAYSDTRHVRLEVSIEKPKIRAKVGLVRLFASADLIGADKLPKRRFGDRLAGKPDAENHVGQLWYSGDDYTAALFMPGDMLAPVLTMLVAGRYRYILLQADKDDPAVYEFDLVEFHGDKPNPAASWDDAFPSANEARLSLAEAKAPSDPREAAIAKWERGEITFDQLPPGRYPHFTIYADGEWEALVRSKPLGKREIAALKAYFEADGAPDLYISGFDTNSRLEARGFIESSTGKDDHGAFRITAAGKEEWLKHHR
ncbi:hypothetical protein ACVWZ4_006120 [Bradyrhizobium sp. USDA 4472]